MESIILSVPKEVNFTEIIKYLASVPGECLFQVTNSARDCS